MKKIIRDKKKKKSSLTPLIERGDIFQDISGAKGTSLLLGKYTMREAEAVLRKRNFYKDARKRGLWPIDFELDSSQFPPLQRLVIYYKEKNPDNGSFITLAAPLSIFAISAIKELYMSLENLVVINVLTRSSARNLLAVLSSVI